LKKSFFLLPGLTGTQFINYKLRLLQKSRVLDFASAVTQYNCVKGSLMQKFEIKRVFLQEAQLLCIKINSKRYNNIMFLH